jgi:hypothetical protein
VVKTGVIRPLGARVFPAKAVVLVVGWKVARIGQLLAYSDCIVHFFDEEKTNQKTHQKIPDVVLTCCRTKGDLEHY